MVEQCRAGESNGAHFYSAVFLLVKGGSKVDVTKLAYLICKVCGIVSCNFNPKLMYKLSRNIS